MSYGVNQSVGLVPYKSQTSSTWNGQTNTYPIQSGYANNIFKGDLIYIATDGYIHNLSDLGAGTYPTHVSWGVFWGCSYQTNVATNPIDPASPGRSYWPANTATLNSLDATAFIIDDPNVVYNVQSNNPGLAFINRGTNASVAYTYVTGSTTSPTGNFNTGESSLVLDSGTLGNGATKNLLILDFVPVAGNVPVAGQGAIPYNNALVLIQNSSFISRPAGHA